MFRKKQGITLSAEAQKIIDMVTANGLEPNQTVSICVEQHFLPLVSPELITEAKYLIDNNSKGELTQNDITNTLAKALRWASRYNINQEKILQDISNHYPYSPKIGSQEDSLTESAKNVMKEAEKIMSELHPDYNDFQIYIGYTTDALCEYWEEMKSKRISYEVFEAMLSLIPQHVPFSVTDALYILRKIEADILLEHPAKEIM